MALSNAPTSPNVHENWLFQFTDDNSTCLEFYPESSVNANDGSYVDIGNALADISPIVNFTVEFWIKPDSVSSVDFPLVLKSGGSEDEEDNDSFNIKLVNDDIFIQYEFGSAAQNVAFTTSDFSVSANTWQHIAVVRSADTDDIRIYKNGVLVETESSSLSDDDPTGADSAEQKLLLGVNSAKTKFFDGEMAHVRIWNVARNATQIARNYLRSVDNTATGLVGYWKLNEGNGTTVLDSSSNSNSGTLLTNHSDGATNLPKWQHNGFDQFIHSFGLAFRHTLADSNTYYGAVINKNITLRDSINLVDGTASTGNISVIVANFTFEEDDFYKYLFNYAERNYHNKEVRVYAQFNDQSALSNCQRIFTGRIAEVTLNQDKTVTIQINTHRPWMGISFPQDKSSKYNIYIPTVYGDFNPNLSNAGTPALVSGDLFPAPVVASSQNDITTLMPRAYADGSNSHLNLWLEEDVFFPAATQSSPYSVIDETVSQGDIDVIVTKLTRRFGGIARAKISNINTSLITFSDTHNAVDGDSNTFATATTTGTSSTDGAMVISFVGPPRKFFFTVLDNISFSFKASASGNVAITLIFQSVDTELSETFAVETYNVGNANQVYDRSYDVAALGLPTDVTIALKFDYGASGKTISISDIQVESRLLIFGGTNDDEDEQDSAELTRIKFLYSGGAGLTASWDNDAIEHGHDTHRDLLQRFAGTPSADPTNWSGFHADRFQTAWKTRFWQLEPTPLKETLDKLAYEFGFNWKIDASGALKYINVVQTAEYNTLRTAGNILNLTGNDVNKVNISTTGLDNVVSKMIINNKLSPAENKYFTKTTITNDTTRAKYNHGDKEGIKEVNLDYNIGTPASSSDPNNNFYAYQNNLIGDMKIIVQCDVVNPAKGYQLETGDVVTFTDMPVEMFGTDFSTSTYFMIVELKRSLGKVSITAREVG